MKRYLLVVTGASRGFGKAFCEAFVEDMVLRNEATIIHSCLLARSESGLAITKQSLQSIASEYPSCELFVTTNIVDLGKLDVLDRKLQQVLQDLTPNKYDKLILVNNAGSLGEIGHTTSMTESSLEAWQKAIDLNVTSMFWVTRRFAQWAVSHSSEAVLVNISSLVAIQPFPTLALYSAGKAARDMYYACLAQELSEHPEVRLLNYAPGPLETDMCDEIRAAPDLHDSLKPHYAKRLLDPKDSAQVLVRLIVEKDGFRSGTHVDYYDVVQPGVS